MQSLIKNIEELLQNFDKKSVHVIQMKEIHINIQQENQIQELMPWILQQNDQIQKSKHQTLGIDNQIQGFMPQILQQDNQILRWKSWNL